MAKKRKFITIYRDSLTGRFAKKSTYKRSKAHGGKRYVRSSISIKTKAKRLPTPALPAVPLIALGVKTWFVTLKYTNTRGTRTFDFFVRAKSTRNVMKYILAFAETQKKLAFSESDPRAASVIAYLDSFGWTEKRIAEIPAGEFPGYEKEPEGFVEYQ